MLSNPSAAVLVKGLDHWQQSGNPLVQRSQMKKIEGDGKKLFHKLGKHRKSLDAEHTSLKNILLLLEEKFLLQVPKK